MFDEEYYENGVATGKSIYTNYRWMPERTMPIAENIIKYADLEPGSIILDFGCAKGFLVYAFRAYQMNSFGVDISEYAISHCLDEVRPYVCCIPEMPESLAGEYDLVVAKDVLEHIPAEELPGWIQNISRVAKRFFVIVPLGNNGKFVIDWYDNDPTHVVKQPLEWWVDLLTSSGFDIELATTEMKGIKINYERYEGGNGYIIAKRRRTEP